MVARFNGRVEDVLQTHHFNSSEDLEDTILRYVRLYDRQLPQSVLKGPNAHRRVKIATNISRSFSGRPYDHAGCDTLVTHLGQFPHRK